LFDITRSTYMTSTVTRRWWASALVQLDIALNVFAQRLRRAGKNFDAAWRKRSRAAVLIRELRAMTDRELHDIGLDRCDIPRIAREAQQDA
jgi:uncharacterized protein YjiS (DUF1127 family)